jgi:hypothetical protein
VFYDAFLICKDTISEDSYNQISGKTLIGLFDDKNNLRQVDIIKNAESIFFARNDEQELFGIDKAKSGSISIFFSDGQIEQYNRYNQIDAKTYPESDFPKNARKLRGFDWRDEERPKSVEDLFSEDPPLKLPKIKGLDDYVPPEEFFDESMIGRIVKAEKQEKPKKDSINKGKNKSNNKKKKRSKAARQVPQNIMDSMNLKKENNKPIIKESSN